MATTYKAPQGLASIASPSPIFSLPTNAAAQSVPSAYKILPPAPLPETLFGTTQQTSFST